VNFSLRIRLAVQQSAIRDFLRKPLESSPRDMLPLAIVRVAPSCCVGYGIFGD
jgi:hypothetical protein